MKTIIRFRTWESVHAGAPEDPVVVEELDHRYDEIMALAAEEYEYEPPSEYFMDGYKLYKRMSSVFR